ncbi:MAG: EAL domain-containing protein [Steroidobacteraceae bacterium]
MPCGTPTDQDVLEGTQLDDSLIAAVPDLVAFVDRQGVIIKYVGGRDIEALPPNESAQGKRLTELWSAPAADALLRMVRRTLKDCVASDGQFIDRDRRYDVRVTPHGRERALCVIRASEAISQPDSPVVHGERVRKAGDAPTVERRAFARRLRQSVADAALRERPLALGMIYLDGLQDVAQVTDFAIADLIMKTLLERAANAAPDQASGTWYVGQLGETILTCVFETQMQRTALESVLEALCQALRETVAIGDASFSLQPCAGVAILGIDAREVRALLEHARAAMFESRRDGGRSVRFYSDTLRLRPLARLDLERELRDAIGNDQLRLRYAARHVLATGERVAVQAYLRWPHPLRGELRPSEFVPLAENTGLAGDLSRWAMARIHADLAHPNDLHDQVPRISFGALRHHIASGALITDLARWLQQWPGRRPQLELRIAERSLAAMPAPEEVLPRLVELGARIVIDEFGRHFSSLTRLVSLPIAALQIDRQFVLGSAHDPAALRLCRGAIAIARELDIPCYASGVDSQEDRDRLQALGISEGIGDCFGDCNPAAPY